MSKTQLNPRILGKLSKKLGLAESTIRQQISTLKQKNARCTLNAVAQIYAMQHNTTVMQQLTEEDKATLPHIEQTKERIKINSINRPKKQKEKIKELLVYSSQNHFIEGHIKELNRAYNYKCYTGAYILSRKIIENLIIELIQKHFPPEKSLDNKELCWDVNQKRFKDFSIILKNLYDKRNDFGQKNKAVERLYQLAKKFKDGANNTTHSWFHLVSMPDELDNLQLQDMIELIKEIEK